MFSLAGAGMNACDRGGDQDKLNDTGGGGADRKRE